MFYDVFNGDADGICALHQLRLANPCPDAQLVTGVKRDIKLLSRIEDAASSTITVLDISLDSNRESLIKLLARENRISYIDHHFAGDIPDTDQLTTHIDPSPDRCTSLIVDTLLDGKYRLWAIAAAFGDNLHDAAAKNAASLSLGPEKLGTLRELGELLNYNGYGADENDLFFSPALLYKKVQPYTDPFDFITASAAMDILRQGFASDMDSALSMAEIEPDRKNRLFNFPNAPWSRRISGVFSNLKAREQPDSAHALIVENADSTFRISVRAPLNNRKNADTLCRNFPTGGGRTAAAGINNLPGDQLDLFISTFHTTWA